MTQQINFLKAITKETNYLPAKWVGLALALLILILAANGIARSVTVYKQEQLLKAAQQEKAQAAADFQQIAQSYPLLAMDKPLVDQVTEYEETLKAKREHFETVTHATIRKPFSSYMEAFAKIVPQDLWLTSFYINQDTENISLRGYSLQPVAVSLLLQALQKSQVFQEVYFDLFYVKRVEDKNYIEFEVANNTLLGPKKAEEKTTVRTNEQKTNTKRL
ncbi:PilN domain-containing protein [Legionella yabuuchiae]|uniref:PilN domain-containing protein n=1 Tax=Legionella yabuuchiae TaxID=376727 RepID=UPI001055B493|nr:PilN domain-containing protein [Legionella yabuuchiae]